MKGSFLQAFLLLDEFDRDRQLLSLANELEFDGHRTINESDNEDKCIERKSTKTLSRVECNLHQAQWEQVNIFYVSFYILSMLILQ
jgi:hypothetical protein